MARITRNDLNAAITHVNDKLRRMGSPYHYEAQSRNGYTAVDLYKGERCRHCIVMGTPKDCIGGLYNNAFDYLHEAACDRLREAATEFTVKPAGECGRCGSTPGERDETCPDCTDLDGNDILTPQA